MCTVLFSRFAELAITIQNTSRKSLAESLTHWRPPSGRKDNKGNSNTAWKAFIRWLHHWYPHETAINRWHTVLPHYTLFQTTTKEQSNLNVGDGEAACSEISELDVRLVQLTFVFLRQLHQLVVPHQLLVLLSLHFRLVHEPFFQWNDLLSEQLQMYVLASHTKTLVSFVCKIQSQ